MINAIVHNLNRGVKLLNSIDDNKYSDITIAPYYSSIGGHIRHILDVFDCIFDGLEIGEVDLAARKRNVLAEQKTNVGLDYFNQVIEKLNSLTNVDLNQIVPVRDDLKCFNSST